MSGLVLVTPEQALEEFRERAGFANVLDALDENPLPVVLIIDQSEQDALGRLCKKLGLREQSKD